MPFIHRNTWRSALHWSLAAALAGVLAGCSSVKVRPELKLPRAVMQPMNARAGLVLEQQLRNYVHEETRGGGDWKIELGPGHEQMFKSVLGASIANLQVFTNVDAARAGSGMQVLFVPHIEQFSFATANETSGAYWAVTIRYRIGLLTPQGEAIDTLSLTGYGSALGAGRAAPSLTAATQAAMRDAASKFLVQLPRQPIAKKLLQGQSLTASDASSTAIDAIELVPILPAGQGG
jgi:hypothetical protein